MTKKLILFLLLVFCSIKVAGQIQRKFFNFTLGITTRQEVINYYKVRKKEIYYSEILGDTDFSVHQVNFGGNTWPVVHFNFYKNKLYLIRFSDSDGFTPRQILDVTWKRLDDSLLSKYRQFMNTSGSIVSEKIFEDNKTRIVFNYDYFQGTKFLGLMYVDTRLQREMLINEDSEL